jgi:NADH-quinone oxidoreductase subunit N
MALLPAYVAAGTAVLVLLVDLVVPGKRGFVVGAGALGSLATFGAAILVGSARGSYTAFCAAPSACSMVTDDAAAVVAGLFALLTLGVLALSTPVLRSGGVPVGEYCFLLACSMTGGVVLGSARDLISLIVALETLTLPLYVLVGLRRSRGTAGAEPPEARRSGASARSGAAGAEAAVTFFVVSVVSTAVALLGAALLYAATGAVHFGNVAAALGAGVDPHLRPLVSAGVVLLLAGLSFKVAAVPLHAWAPVTYDGAPLPIAAYLSTASKLGGVVALIMLTLGGFGPVLGTAGPALAVLAVLTMTVGNLIALRQRRLVRLLAWSSIAQAGYILAPLGAYALHGGRSAAAVPVVLAATVAYTVFYVVLEFGAFAAVVGLRGDQDGGAIDDYRGVARRSPWLATALVLALAGLAGLPPGLAGLFAKVAVVRALLGGDSVWLAVVVALNAVIGLAYYVRVAATLFGSPVSAASARVSWAVGTAVGVATLAAVGIGFAPQLVMSLAGAVHP